MSEGERETEWEGNRAREWPRYDRLLRHALVVVKDGEEVDLLVAQLEAVDFFLHLKIRGDVVEFVQHLQPRVLIDRLRRDRQFEELQGRAVSENQLRDLLEVLAAVRLVRPSCGGCGLISFLRT